MYNQQQHYVSWPLPCVPNIMDIPTYAGVKMEECTKRAYFKSGKEAYGPLILSERASGSRRDFAASHKTLWITMTRKYVLALVLEIQTV